MELMRECAPQMEKTRKYGLCAAVAVLALIAAGLCAYVFIDFRLDGEARQSQMLIAEAGEKSSARALADDLGGGDMMLAYHHALKAAEYAHLAGNDSAARMFEQISADVRGGKVDGSASDAITGYLDGETAEYGAARGGENGVSGEAEAVSADVYGMAEEMARRFFGGVMTKGERIPNGNILFSVANAYAVIDGTQCVPIEAAVSLGEGEARYGRDACVRAALGFIGDFFPEEVSRAVKIISADEGSTRTDVYAESGGVQMCITVRRDTGRVVRFVSGAR